MYISGRGSLDPTKIDERRLELFYHNKLLIPGVVVEGEEEVGLREADGEIHRTSSLPTTHYPHSNPAHEARSSRL